jgi:hypothetical protein
LSIVLARFFHSTCFFLLLYDKLLLYFDFWISRHWIWRAHHQKLTLLLDWMSQPAGGQAGNKLTLLLRFGRSLFHSADVCSVGAAGGRHFFCYFILDFGCVFQKKNVSFWHFTLFMKVFYYYENWPPMKNNNNGLCPSRRRTNRKTVR